MPGVQLIWESGDAGLVDARRAWDELDRGSDGLQVADSELAWWTLSTLLLRDTVAHGVFKSLGAGCAGLSGLRTEWVIDAMTMKEQLAYLRLPEALRLAVVAHKGKPMDFVGHRDGLRSQMLTFMRSMGSGDSSGHGGAGYRPMTADQVLGKLPGSIQIHDVLQSPFYKDMMARLNGGTATLDKDWGQELCATTFSAHQRATMLALLAHKERSESAKEKDEAKPGTDAAMFTAFLDQLKVNIVRIVRTLLENRTDDSDESAAADITTGVVDAVVKLCLQLPADEPATGEKGKNARQKFGNTFMGTVMSQLYLFSAQEEHHQWHTTADQMRVSDMHHCLGTFAKVMLYIWGPKIGKDGAAYLVAWSKRYDSLCEGGITWPGGLLAIVNDIAGATINEWAKGLREELRMGSTKRVESWSVVLERDHLGRSKKTRCAQYERAMEHLSVLKTHGVRLTTPKALGESMGSPFVTLGSAAVPKAGADTTKGFQGKCNLCGVTGHRAKACPTREKGKPSPKKQKQEKVCNQFRDEGKCKYGAGCRFRHDEDSGGRGRGTGGGAGTGSAARTACSDCGSDQHKKGDRDCDHMQAYWAGMKLVHTIIAKSKKSKSCVFWSLKRVKCSCSVDVCTDKSRRPVSHDKPDQMTHAEVVDMIMGDSDLIELFNDSIVKHRFMALLDSGIRSSLEARLKGKKTRR